MDSLKRIISLIIIVTFVVTGSFRIADAARTGGAWESVGSYVRTVFSGGKDVLINGTNKYLNFGFTSGSSGYGFRDNSGRIEFKHSGESWLEVGSGSGGGGGSGLWATTTDDTTIYPLSTRKVLIGNTSTSTTADLELDGSFNVLNLSTLQGGFVSQGSSTVSGDFTATENVIFSTTTAGTLLSTNSGGNVTSSSTVSTNFIENLSGSNTGDVSLSGTPDYITISGQTITRNTVDIGDDTNLAGGNLISISGDTVNSSALATSSIDTESELETIVSDATNIFTNNDGALTDDDLSDDDTDDLSEGVSNLYYTDARVEGVINASSSIMNTVDFDTESEFESALFSVVVPSENNDTADDLSDNDTDDLSEGASNLYYTDSRVESVINASSTLLNDNTESGLESYLSGVSDVFTNNDGALSDDDLSDDSINTLSDVSVPSPSAGQVLEFDGSNWVAATDDTGGGGGSGLWATTSDDLAIYPSDTTDTVIVGSNATSSGGIFEVNGSSTFEGNVDITGSINSGTWNGTAIDFSDYTNATAGNLISFSNDTINSSALATSSIDTASELNSIVSDGALSDDDLSDNSTTDLSEGTNLYYTTARFAGDLAGTTTDALSEGSNNLYYTDSRVNDVINSSSTILQDNTESGLESYLSDVTDVFTGNDGSLSDDDLSDDAINALSNVDTTGQSAPDLFGYDGTNWNATSTISSKVLPSEVSLLGQDISLSSEVSGELGAGNGGTGNSSYSAGDFLYAIGATSLAKLSSSDGILSMSSNNPSWISTEADFESVAFNVVVPSENNDTQDDLSNDDFEALQNVSAMTEAEGDVLLYKNGGWTRLASSTDGQVLEIGTDGYPAWGTDDTGSGSGAFTSGNGSTTLDNAGDNVGIASSSPFAKLSVVGDAGQTNPTFRIASSSGSSMFTVDEQGWAAIGRDNPRYGLDLNGSGNGDTLLADDGTDGTRYEPSGVFGHWTGRNLTIGGTDGIDFKIYNNGAGSWQTEGVVDGNGNFGFGTTSPYTQLSVVGETVATNFTATSTQATSTFSGGFSADSGLLTTKGNEVLITNPEGNTDTDDALVIDGGNIFLDTDSVGGDAGVNLAIGANNTGLNEFGDGLDIFTTGTVAAHFNETNQNLSLGAGRSPSLDIAIDDADSGINGSNTSLDLILNNTTEASVTSNKLTVTTETESNYFTATSTTATSTFAGHVNLDNGITMGGDTISDFTGNFLSVSGETLTSSALGTTSIDTASEINSIITDGALSDDDVSDDDLTALQNVSISGVSSGEVLEWNGSSWVNATDDTGSGSSASTTAVTVCASGCDYTSIQTALDSGETDIYLHPETFSEQIEIKNAKTKITGAGTDSVISCNGDTQSPCVSATNTSQTAIRDLKINDTQSSTTGIGLDVSDNPNSYFDNLRISGFATGTKVSDINSTSFYSSFENLTLFDNASCFEVSGTRANDNYMQNIRCRQAAGEGGIGFYFSDARGWTLDTINAEPSSSGSITGVKVASSSSEITLINPWLEGNNVGINLTSTSDKVTVIGGTIAASASNGIIDNGTSNLFLNTSDGGTTYTQYSDDFQMNDSDFVLNGASADFRGSTAIDFYPGGQVSRAMRVSDGSDRLFFSMTGGSLIEINDDLEVNNGNSLTVSNETFTDFTGAGLVLNSGALDVDQTANFTWTGLHDFGGATSLELPNGASPTVDAAGEIAVDTTSGQLIWHDGSEKKQITDTVDRSLPLASTTPDFIGATFETGTSTYRVTHPSDAVTLTDIYCETDSGNTTVRVGDGTNWSGYLECGTAGATDSSPANNSFTAREDVQVQVGSNSAGGVTITTTWEVTAD